MVNRFRTKVDWWFIVIYAVLAAQLGGPVVHALTQGRQVPPVRVFMTVLVLGGLAYLAISTCYVLTDASLIIRWGPFRSTVPLAAIYKLRASTSWVASPALSLDRIEVLARTGPYALISPADKAGFIREVCKRAPDVELEGLERPG